MSAMTAAATYRHLLLLPGGLQTSNRYLIYGTYRADGSNKYQEKWGYFPTVGVGWVLSSEDFLTLPDQLPEITRQLGRTGQRPHQGQ